MNLSRSALFLAISLGLGVTACADPDLEGQDEVLETDTTGAAVMAPQTIKVDLIRQSGVTGTQRVNFAVPFAQGQLTDATKVRVRKSGTTTELQTSRRILAKWPDGSIRSLQLQPSVDSTTTALDVDLNTAGTKAALSQVDITTTLMSADGKSGPKVWAILPATWIAQSGVTGPMVSRSAIAGTTLDAWQVVCDYTKWSTDAFLSVQSDKGAWLYDRTTAMYRGYAYVGGQAPLRSAYREAAIYRAGVTGTGTATRIGVPGASADLKYHYTQGMAIHYLLTGDDRFREAAENVAIRTHELWKDPGYEGATDFWTERNAGFALLAYEWAAAVSDDKAATFAGWSDVAVPAYLKMLDAAQGYEADAKCFAHHADAHGEPYGYVGCSPWMSAILADGLDAYQRRVGGTKATSVKAGLVKMGKMIARHGLDSTGRPYYWMGAGTTKSNEADGYNEHWGEAAYVVAMAWNAGGRSDAALKASADKLVAGMKSKGTAGQVRSFNWQCRSATATPAFLK